MLSSRRWAGRGGSPAGRSRSGRCARSASKQTCSPTSPTTDGIIALLSGYDLVGRTVGVQLYGEEPNLPLMEFLCDAGATADPVAPYAYADEVDGERVADLIERIAAGGVDVLALTSASQVKRLWSVARARGLGDALRDGLSNTVVAAVGPVAADEARRAGMNPTIMPARVHAMKTWSSTRSPGRCRLESDRAKAGRGYGRPRPDSQDYTTSSDPPTVCEVPSRPLMSFSVSGSIANR